MRGLLLLCLRVEFINIGRWKRLSSIQTAQQEEIRALEAMEQC